MVDYPDVVRAREKIREAVYESPCAYSETFSKLTGLRIYFKLENLQMTGSFKERGALNKLVGLAAAKRKRGVIAASAGNHAQGLAYHATRLGIRSTVVMPEATALIKIARTRGHGAEVILHGDDYDAAVREATRRADAEGLTLVHAFDDDAVIAGQGTIGLELLEQEPSLEVIVVPVGGGGLIGGIALAAKHLKPHVRILGVQCERIPSALAALKACKPVTVDAARTIADGIAVRRVGTRTLPVIQELVDDVVTVNEEEIANAVLLLLENEKTVAEGAGAAALAAVLNQKVKMHVGQHVAVLVSGGNIDVNLLSRIIERGLAKDGRLLRLEVKLTDVPGSLHQLLGLLARAHANVMQVTHDRAFTGASLGETLVDVTMETRGRDHVEEIVSELREAGYEARRFGA